MLGMKFFLELRHWWLLINLRFVKIIVVRTRLVLFWFEVLHFLDGWFTLLPLNQKPSCPKKAFSSTIHCIFEKIEDLCYLQTTSLVYITSDFYKNLLQSVPNPNKDGLRCNAEEVSWIRPFTQSKPNYA